MAWAWVERDGFLVRYIAYKNSRCKDAEEIQYTVMSGEQRVILFVRYRRVMGDLAEKREWN